MDIKAIAVFILVGLFSPVLGYWAHLLIQRHKVRAAAAFLEADPLVFEGSRFLRLLNADGSQMMGPGRIAEIEGGRLLAVSSDGSARVPFDALEFKSMYPHWADPGPGGDDRGEPGLDPELSPGPDGEETYS